MQWSKTTIATDETQFRIFHRYISIDKMKLKNK